MSKEFSMATVLRRTPFKMLRWFLPDVGIDLDFDWEKLHAYDLPRIIAAYEQYPEAERVEAEKIVQGIVVLANKKGVEAMNKAANACDIGYWEVIFRNEPSPYLQAIWAWSAHREMFEQAKKILAGD